MKQISEVHVTACTWINKVAWFKLIYLINKPGKLLYIDINSPRCGRMVSLRREFKGAENNSMVPVQITAQHLCSQLPLMTDLPFLLHNRINMSKISFLRKEGRNGMFTKIVCGNVATKAVFVFIINSTWSNLVAWNSPIWDFFLDFFQPGTEIYKSGWQREVESFHI